MLRCACAVALLCAALAHAHTLKRAEMSASPFVLSSRYGRAEPRALEPRALQPRNDRFFLGGRYGKRAALPAGGARGGGACACAPYPPALYYNRASAGGVRGARRAAARARGAGR